MVIVVAVPEHDVNEDVKGYDLWGIIVCAYFGVPFITSKNVLSVIEMAVVRIDWVYDVASLKIEMRFNVIFKLSTIRKECLMAKMANA